MSQNETEPEYASLTFEAQETPDPFRFKIGEGEGRKAWEEKFELPALDDPGLPFELLELAVLAISGKSEDEAGRLAFGSFTKWFQDVRPDIVRALNKHTQTAPVFMALISQWAEFSGITPKA